MQGGDISNEIVPRIHLVFEGLVGLPPKRTTHRWWRGLGCRSFTDPRRWEINPAATKVIWHLWGHDWGVDVVTHLLDAEALAERLSDLPIGQVYATTPSQHGRELSCQPHVVAVLDPEPGRQFSYPAGRGVVVDPDNPAASLAALGL
ncbi:hypothetical protein [Actinomadura atramentaria]|uniref:hypothetical protein n=1 Tax=Actinomadura atramentaria TaxID=1990 RepID=UPI000382D42F|nr:hypothetical protein [Actinomadura atramentaria]